MKKETGHQKIKCSVSDCSYNCVPEKACTLDEISVCNCTSEKTANTLKDTACSSYEFKGKDKKQYDK